MQTCFSTSSVHRATPENDFSRVLPPTRTSSRKETYVASTDVSYLQYDTIRYCVFNVQSKTDGQPAYSTMWNRTNLNEKELKI